MSRVLLFAALLAVVAVAQVHPGDSEYSHSVYMHVWEDLDRDGVREAGEPSIPGVKAQLIYSPDMDEMWSGPVVISTEMSNHDGVLRFTCLKLGSYQVSVQLADGFNWTAPGQSRFNTHDSDVDPLTSRTMAFELEASDNGGKLDLGAGMVRFVSGATVRGWAFGDANLDSKQSVGEMGVPFAVDVTLLDARGMEVASMETNANGYYEFEGLAAGSYAIRVPNTDVAWQFAEPNVGVNDNIDSDVVPDAHGARSALRDVEVGDVVVIDAGYQLTPARVEFFTYNDFNEDGIFDDGDLPIANVNTHLYSAFGVLLDSKLSDVNGHVVFNNIVGVGIPRRFYIKVDSIDNALFSPKHVGTDPLVDSDVDVNTGLTDIFTLGGFEIKRDLAAGIYFTLGVVRASVWEDYNIDGLRQVDEPAREGIRVTLLNKTAEAEGVFDYPPISCSQPPPDANGHCFTDPNGVVVFRELTPAFYQLAFAKPDEYLFTIRGGDSDVEDSPGTELEGHTELIDVRLGTNVNYQAGVKDYFVRIEGQVWNDTNLNGVIDADEEPISLQPNSGAPLLISYTNALDAPFTPVSPSANGYYMLPRENLEPGLWRLRFAAIEDNQHIFSPMTSGNDQGVDVNGEYVSVHPSGARIVVNAGYHLPAGAIIDTFVWEDVNGNGQFDEADEPGINGVELWRELVVPGNPLDAPGEVPGTTDALGRITWDDLNSGIWRIRCALNITEDGPDYFLVDQLVGGNPANSSSASTVDGVSSQSDLARGDVATYLCGYFRPASVRVNYFYDEDRDGTSNGATETSPANAVVELLDADGAVVNTYTTGLSDTHHEFDNLRPGWYSVRFTLPPYRDEFLPYTFTPTCATAGCSDFVPAEPRDRSATFGPFLVRSASTAVENVVTAGFEVLPGATLTGFAFVDRNQDAEFNVADAIVGNPTGGWDLPQQLINIYLEDATGAPFTPFFEDALFAARTDLAGEFTLDHVPEGEYHLRMDGWNVEDLRPLVADPASVWCIDTNDNNVVRTCSTFTVTAADVEGTRKKRAHLGFEMIFHTALVHLWGKMYQDCPDQLDVTLGQTLPVAGRQLLLLDTQSATLEEVTTDANGAFFFGFDTDVEGVSMTVQDKLLLETSAGSGTFFLRADGAQIDGTSKNPPDQSLIAEDNGASTAVMQLSAFDVQGDIFLAIFPEGGCNGIPVPPTKRDVEERAARNMTSV